MVNKADLELEKECKENDEVRVRLWQVKLNNDGILKFWKERPVKATIYMDIARAVRFRKLEKEREILKKGREDWAKLTPEEKNLHARLKRREERKERIR